MKLLPFRKPGSRPAQVETVRLIIVEDGAFEFDSRIAPDGANETVVVAQLDGEPPDSLKTRVVARLATVDRGGRKVDQAVLLVGSGGHGVAAARQLMARALLSHLVACGGRELVFDAEGAAADLRYELLSQVQSLIEEFPQTSVPIRLQFNGGPARRPRPSGIHPIPSAEARTLDAVGDTVS